MKSVVWCTAAVVAVTCGLAGGLTAQETGETTRAGAPPVRSSWISDAMAVRVGSVVTVLVDEVTLVTADKSVIERKDRGRQVAFNLPLTGIEAALPSGRLETGHDVGRSQTGASNRREQFATELSARVVEIDGIMARIEGVKRLQVDKHEQTVTVRGWVRTTDINTDNTVESWRLANAEILYESNGKLGNPGGFWSKILDLILP
jgi:flagellar L-ring protein precursor FlgH